MDHVYPPGPAAVPPNLTAATAAYKHRAWLAMGGLAAFIVLYFALSGWFAWTAWRLFDGMFGDRGQLRPLPVRRRRLRRLPRGVHAQGAVLHPASFRRRGHRDHAPGPAATLRLHRPAGRRSPRAARPQGVPVGARERGGVLRPVAAESHHPLEEEPRDRPRARQRGHARRTQGRARARVRAFRAALHGRRPLGLHLATDRRPHRRAPRCARQTAGADCRGSICASPGWAGSSPSSSGRSAR